MPELATPGLRSVTYTLPQLASRLAEHPAPMRISAPEPSGYAARIRHCVCDGIEFTEIVAAPHETAREWAEVDPDATPRLVLALVLAGSGYVRQRSRTAQLMVGDLAVFESQTPYRTGFHEDSRALVVSFPMDSLEFTRDDITSIAAVTVSGRSGVGALVVPFLSQLATNLELLGGPVGPRTAMSVRHLVGTLLGAHLLQRAHGRSRSDLMFRQVCSWIERHLDDPALTPDGIATEFYLSKRRLYAMFQKRGVSVAGWIRQLRLSKCAQDLRDPTQAHLAVAEISRRYGFADPAHFSRSFKLRYGESPARYRDLSRSRG